MSLGWLVSLQLELSTETTPRKIISERVQQLKKVPIKNTILADQIN
jgi:hypothetical protein